MSNATGNAIRLKDYGLATLSEFLGDRVAYRNLAPCDPQLDGLERVGPRVGLPPGCIPRKSDADYARVVTHFLRQARVLQASQHNTSRHSLRRLIFVGDTRLLDGTAFSNLCAAGDWPGLAFIGSENSKPAEAQIVSGEGDERLYLSNRWAALAEFDRFCAAQGLPVDEDAVVVVDLDKTALGARGRNAAVIDAARVAAVQQTVAGLLGDAFDLEAFCRAYEPLNQPEFHTFTGDNQDYLAYVCLMLGAGLDDLDALMASVRAGEMTTFDQFIQSIEQRKAALPGKLTGIHAEIYANVQAGDPTPFKAFRRREYRTTQKRFGCLPADAPLERRLQDEILITEEVRAMALEWARRGALLFGLSDKPDEAATPTPELAAQGYRSLHQTPTHAVGVF
jgi:hypothetical protein